MLLKSLVVCFLAFATTISSEDEAAKEAPKAQVNENANINSLIDGLTQQINGIQKRLDNSDSDATQLNSLQSKLTTLEQSTQGITTKVNAIDETLSQQKNEITKESQTLNQKISELSTNFQSIEAIAKESKELAEKSITQIEKAAQSQTEQQGQASDVDLSNYVSKNDFNELKAELDSLKSLLTTHGTSHELHSTEFASIKDNLNSIETKYDTSISESNKKITNIGKSMSALQIDITELKKLNGEMQALKDTKSQSDKALKQLKQMETLVTRVETTVKRLDDEMDSVVSETVRLEDLIGHVKSQTIGSMIEQSIEVTKKLAIEGYEIGKEYGAIFMKVGKEKGANFLAASKVKALELVEAGKVRGLKLVEEIKNYDYSWLTDKENWRLFGNWVLRVLNTCRDYTSHEIIPAIKKQSTQAVNQIRDFFVNFYETRREHELYKEVSNVVLPLLKQIEALPKEYHLVTLDVLVAIFVLLLVLIAWAMFLCVCNCLCPKIDRAKIDDSSRNSNNNNNNNNNTNTNTNNSNNNKNANVSLLPKSGNNGVANKTDREKSKKKKNKQTPK